MAAAGAVVEAAVVVEMLAEIAVDKLAVVVAERLAVVGVMVVGMLAVLAVVDVEMIVVLVVIFVEKLELFVGLAADVHAESVLAEAGVVVAVYQLSVFEHPHTEQFGLWESPFPL